jgi:hypothetical protein
MRAITKFAAGGIAVAALAIAAPAAAQYYPGYGYPGYGYGNPYDGNVVGQVLNQVLGGGYGNYGINSQAAVNQCASAVQARLSGGYGGYGGYGGGYGAYGSNYGYSGGARVLGISRVEPRGNGGLTVRGVATTGRYGVSYGGEPRVDLTWRCRIDYRGFVSDIDIDRAQSNYGYGYNNGYTGSYTPYNNYDYSQYGYRRY